MEDDPELMAMSSIAAALKGLDPDITVRVLDWAAKRYRPVGAVPEIKAPVVEPESFAQQFADFATFFDKANPQTLAEKALVAGYWFQTVLGQEDFDSATVNKELKHLGHASLNITRDFDGLMSTSPRLVIQTRKSGSAQQARKLYKLTTEGAKTVQRMLTRQG